MVAAIVTHLRGRIQDDLLHRPTAGQSRGLGFFIRQGEWCTRMQVGLPEATCLSCQWLRIRGGDGVPDLYIGNVYMPSASRSADEYADALNALRTDTRRFSELGEVVLLGDFNARVGRAGGEGERVGCYGEERRDSRGKMLIDFLEAADLYILNGRRPCEEPEWTREQRVSRGAAAGTTQLSILDYVMANADSLAHLESVPSKSRNSFQVMHRAKLDHADHHLLRFDLNTWGTARHRRSRRPKRRQAFFRWRLNRLLEGPLESQAAVREAYSRSLEEAQQQFEEYVGEQLQQHGPGDAAAEAVAGRWLQIVIAAARSAVGQRRIIPGRAKAWWCAEVAAAVRARRKAYARWRTARRTGREEERRWAAYEERRRTAKAAVRNGCRQHEQQQGGALTQLARSNPRAFWRRLKTMVGSSKAGTQRVAAVQDPGRDGALVTDDAEIADVFARHYARLAAPAPEELPPQEWREQVERRVAGLAAATSAAATATATAGRSAGATTTTAAAAAAAAGSSSSGQQQQQDLLGRPLTEEEVGAALAQLANGSAPHDDGIPNELLKYGEDGMRRLTTTLLNVMLECRTVPAVWRLGTIVSIPKPGGCRTDPGDYRGITLLATIGKLFCRCLQNRMAAAVALHEGQSGFRAGRECADNLFVLSGIINQRKAEGRLTYAFFLDVKKAFDSVWHDGMWSKLWDKGVRGRVWDTVRNMYSKMRSRVRVNGVTSSDFPVLRGTAQGCTLSPLLFNIFIDGLLDAVDAAGLGALIGALRLPGLMFADDFCGTTDDDDKLQRLIDVVYDYLQEWGLQANVSKSAVVVFGGSRAPRPTRTWTWGNAAIPLKTEYKYLGIILHSDGSWRHAVAAAYDRARQALATYAPYLSSRHLAYDVRLLVYKMYVRPRLEYGAEVWQPSQEEAKKLEQLQLAAARMVLGCFGGTASVAVLAELGLEPLAMRRLRAQLRFGCRLATMAPSRYPALVHASAEAARASLPQARRRALWGEGLDREWGALAGGNAVPPSASADPATAKQNLASVVEANMAAEMNRRTTLTHLPLLSLYPNKLQPYLRGRGWSKGREIKMKCRTGSLEINHLLFKRTLTSSPACPCCGGAEESVQHILLHCPEYNDIRTEMLLKIRSLFHQTRRPASALFLAPHLHQTAMLLGDRTWVGMNCFTEADSIVCDFLEKMWDARARHVSS